jgi:iron complex outermembrane recepter protein
MMSRKAMIGCSAAAIAVTVYGAASAQTSSGPAPAPGDETQMLGEVVVTAQKRSERLLETPVPVTAVAAPALLEANQVRLQDYYVRIPGLQVTPGDFHGAPMLTVRGITTGGFANPTVGVVVDDVPYGSSTGVNLAQEAPDIDPSELAQVEVLRGPQGTLYGATSLGGLLKYVTVDPAFSGFSGRLQVGALGVHEANDLGYNIRGALNVPVSETLAVRVSAFTRQDPGYIDNPRAKLSDVNERDAYGGRVAALWQPTANTSLKLGALHQRSESNGSARIFLQPTLGELEQLVVADSGGFTTELTALNAIARTSFGPVRVTSITGYNISHFADVQDWSVFRAAQAQTLFGVPGAVIVNDFTTKKLSQELRIEAPLGDRIDLLAGLFYTRERTNPRQQDIYGADPLTGRRVGAISFDTNPHTYTERAIFATATVRVTESFDVQLGARQSYSKQSTSRFTAFPTAPTTVFPDVRSKDDAFTFLVTPRLRVSPDLMIYARVASGFRPGGPNPNAFGFNLPQTFDPDTTRNYEVGVKGRLFDRRLSYDLSLYRIDWKNMQVQLVTGGRGYYVNAGASKSEGLEASFQLQPWSGMILDASGSWGRARLTEGFPPGSTAAGNPGDRLPYSARFTGFLGAEQSFPVTQTWTGFVGGSISYVGDRLGVFRNVALRQTFPSYSQIDARAGVRSDVWTASVFINNLGDKRGVLTGGLGTAGDQTAFNLLQPRTIGVSLARSF